MDIFLVVVHDTIVQSREYAVLAKDMDDAKQKVKDGKFLTESEATTVEHISESQIISADKIGETHAGS